MSKAKFSRAAAGLTLAASMIGTTGCNINNGTGEQVGVVSRFQTDGWFDSCKTWEGEIASINMRGMKGSGSTLDFTVRDPEVAKQINDAMNHQTPIRVYFSQTSNPWPCHQGNNDIVTSVSPMEVSLLGPLASRQSATNDNSEQEDSAVAALPAGARQTFVCTAVAAPTSAAHGVTPVAAPPPKPDPQKGLPDVLRMNR